MPQKTTNVVLDTNTKVTKKTLDSEDNKVPRVKKNSDMSSPDDGAIITATKKSKDIANRENISCAFNDLINMVETEIKDARDSSSKTCDIKFLRSVNKSIKTLRVQCERAIKKTSTTRQNNHNSGLQKPVKLSSELAKFTGWPEDELHSRVDVTKYICDYIATNKLQNPEDKRQILPDAKLQKLLGFNPEKADKPLYYYGIQTYLKNQNHFPKDAN
jgi:chromatin remodeling complex protein RSC6